jgi:hypothetical protein
MPTQIKAAARTKRPQKKRKQPQPRKRRKPQKRKRRKPQKRKQKRRRVLLISSFYYFIAKNDD